MRWSAAGGRCVRRVTIGRGIGARLLLSAVSSACGPPGGQPPITEPPTAAPDARLYFSPSSLVVQPGAEFDLQLRSRSNPTQRMLWQQFSTIPLRRSF